eukprot:TRINITY_DN1233_c0_g1_i2.p1 TRINITY_DN1233_c0_g1~~TRINITY_DN1233_c0_g1_i2.p1  ORF type:complete len:405 (+),score=80.43 TRINITY_DN1233_c0_g1_i2:116-1216(+)
MALELFFRCSGGEPQSLEVEPNATVGDLRAAVAAAMGVAAGVRPTISWQLSELIDDAASLADIGIGPQSTLEVTVQREILWDTAAHPQHVEYSEDKRSAVFKPLGYIDCLYLVSEEPVGSGYFEISMDKQQDEVWAGLSADNGHYGSGGCTATAPPMAWVYYGGRRGQTNEWETSAVLMGKAGRRLCEREQIEAAAPYTTGARVGCAVDLVRGRLQYYLNGVPQGCVCEFPTGSPLWAVCTFDKPGDPDAAESPPVAWIYYGGRRGMDSEWEKPGILMGRRTGRYDRTHREGNVPAAPYTTGAQIGCAVDQARNRAQFFLNGEPQGGPCELPPDAPLWACVSLDIAGDKVTVSRPPPPPAAAAFFN